MAGEGGTDENARAQHANASTMQIAMDKGTPLAGAAFTLVTVAARREPLVTPIVAHARPYWISRVGGRKRRVGGRKRVGGTPYQEYRSLGRTWYPRQDNRLSCPRDLVGTQKVDLTDGL